MAAHHRTLRSALAVPLLAALALWLGVAGAQDAPVPAPSAPASAGALVAAHSVEPLSIDPYASFDGAGFF